MRGEGMENNYFALIATDVKKLWNSLDSNQKLGMLGFIVLTIIKNSCIRKVILAIVEKHININVQIVENILEK